jgi:hypothetical protein
MPFSTAIELVKEKEYSYRTTTAEESQSVLSGSSIYRKSKGGPVITLFFPLGTTWWGFKAQDEYNLFFDEEEKLEVVAFEPVNRFL